MIDEGKAIRPYQESRTAIIPPGSSPLGSRSRCFYSHSVISAVPPIHVSTQAFVLLPPVTCNTRFSQILKPSRTWQEKSLPLVHAALREAAKPYHFTPFLAFLEATKAEKATCNNTGPHTKGVTQSPAVSLVPKPQEGQAFWCCSAARAYINLPPLAA